VPYIKGVSGYLGHSSVKTNLDLYVHDILELGDLPVGRPIESYRNSSMTEPGLCYLWLPTIRFLQVVT
jgi:hypothetical protein